MNKRNWKIVYTNYDGIEKKAIELLSSEMGAHILRDQGVYTIHVLACQQADTAVLDSNAVVIGLYEENSLIRKYIDEVDVPADGYAVKVMNDPENAERKLVLITAQRPVNLFYGAIDFVDDYFSMAAPVHGSVKLADELFMQKWPDYFHISVPAIKTRSVFTWGHPINDYRNYIENMARLKLNQLIIWNDFVPLNAKDVVAYAHEYGISVIWGFAWGWLSGGCQIDLSTLDEIGENVIRTYESQYADVAGDGIYFQSFTERRDNTIDGRNIAQTVTDFVNGIASRLLQKYPDLHIQFGLHATSVRDDLEYITKVDPRIEILWEDCGSFPYGYHPQIRPGESYEETEHFVDKILALRQQGSTGMLFKGFMTLDWNKGRFVHQAGPYVMGMASRRLVEHDVQMLAPIWKNYQSGWLENGRYAYEMARHIYETGKPVTLGMAGQFAGGIWFPEALCAEFFWNCDRPYEQIIAKVLRRRCIQMA